MQDLYRGFKKVSEDENGAVLEHEQGHRLTIAKSGLSKKHLKSLSKLPLHQVHGTEPSPELPEEEKRQPLRELDMGEEAKQVGKEVVGSVAQKMLEGAQEITAQPPEKLKADLQQWSQEQQAPVEEAPQGFAGKLAQKTPMPGDLTPEQKASHFAPMQTPMAPTESVMGGPTLMAPVQQAAPEKAGLVEQKGLATDTRALAETPTEQLPPSSQLPEPPAAPTKAPKYASLMDVAADPNQPESIRVEALMQEEIRLTKEYNDQLSEWRKTMANKPDNERASFFSNRDTWGKIGVALGLLMGGMSSGITGRPNPVLEMLNKELEEETNRQKNASEKEMNLFKMNLQALGDQRQAFLQTINQLRELSQLKGDEIAGKSGNTPQSRMAAQALFAENQAKIAKANSERAQNNMAQVMRYKRDHGIAGEIPDLDDPWIDRAVRVKMPDDQVVKRYVKDKSLMKEASDNFSALRRVQDLTKAINVFNAQYGQTTSIPLVGSKDLNERAASLNKQANVALTALLSGAEGKVRPGLLDEFKEIMPKAGAMFWNQSEQQSRVVEVNNMISNIRSELMDKYLVQ